MSHDDPFSSSFNKKGCIWAPVWICVHSSLVQEKKRIENLPAQHQLQFQNRKYLVLLFIVQPFEISLEDVKVLKYTSEPWYTIKIDQIFSFPFSSDWKRKFSLEED